MDARTFSNAGAVCRSYLHMQSKVPLPVKVTDFGGAGKAASFVEFLYAVLAKRFDKKIGELFLPAQG